MGCHLMFWSNVRHGMISNINYGCDCKMLSDEILYYNLCLRDYAGCAEETMKDKA